MEQWKDIKGYEGLYQVSSEGRIKSVERVRKNGKNSFQTQQEKILRNTADSKGKYLQVCLSKNGVQRRYLVHRLVAQAFIENTNNYEVVNHKDHNTQNNSVDNLEWCTSQYNNMYSAYLRFKPVIQFDLKGNIIDKFQSITEASEKLSIPKTMITKVCKGKRKTTYGFVFKYA